MEKVPRFQLMSRNVHQNKLDPEILRRCGNLTDLPVTKRYDRQPSLRPSALQRQWSHPMHVSDFAPTLPLTVDRYETLFRADGEPSSPRLAQPVPSASSRNINQGSMARIPAMSPRCRSHPSIDRLPEGM